MVRDSLEDYIGSMSITRLHIPNFKAATDAAHLEKALEAVSRVTSVTVSPGAQQIDVEHEGANLDQLTNAVRQLGYSVSID